jgi:2-methylcitrate dehydratase PrpD
MIAAAHAGARSPEVSAILAGLPAGAGPSTILATGECCAPQSAAFANATFSLSQDFDDILGTGLAGHSAAFAALAVAEAEDRRGQEPITAVVAADEVAGRLGASAFFGPLDGQMALAAIEPRVRSAESS